jgi:hypothetical protein
MTKAGLVLLFLLTVTSGNLTSGALASNQHFYSNPNAAWAEPSRMTCDTVRAYVRQIGFAQARAIALANGMTAAQERQARRCLAKRG